MNRDELIEELKKAPDGEIEIEVTIWRGYPPCSETTLVKIDKVRTVPRFVIEASR